MLQLGFMRHLRAQFLKNWRIKFTVGGVQRMDNIEIVSYEAIWAHGVQVGTLGVGSQALSCSALAQCSGNLVPIA
jgi:hypothetical protein